MEIMGLGIEPDGELLFQPTAQSSFANLILAEWGNFPQTTGGGNYRGEIKPAEMVEGDPLVLGWTFLINGSDPNREKIIEILQPLAECRGMEEPFAPLLFNGEIEDEWMDWVEKNYSSRQLEGKIVPHYILIVGNPQLIPFKFQSFLDTFASVGRLDFDLLNDLETYIQKVMRIESAPQPLVEREALLFATDQGLPDPTYYSRKYMVDPLKEYAESRLQVPTFLLAGTEATKTNFSKSLSERKPALVYTASHGLGAIRKPVDFQIQYNGAICCQRLNAGDPVEFLSGDDIPFDQPFLEGSIFFQFACFGYGTPATSDFSHLRPYGVRQDYSGQEFVSALPKRLLAHDRGPLAYIGHLDMALLHGFTDPEAPQGTGRWGARMSVFVALVTKILGVKTAGMALQGINDLFNSANFAITNTYNRKMRGDFNMTEQAETRLVDNWLRRTDAQNFMILGDPAVRVRLPDK